MKTYFAFFLLCLISTVCVGQVYDTENLKIEQLSENVYQHISFLNTKNYGNYPSNGMVYFNGQGAIVFDTPVNSKATQELMEWIEKEQQKKIKAVVVTHFHIDCLGGLAEFHENGIPSYANRLTIELASEKGEVLPQYGIESELVLRAGNEAIFSKYFGKGHTHDNIVAYIPSEKVLFGGCLIKEMGAGKGNLADASPADWSQTVKNIQVTWPDIQKVIPGHGSAGSAELLDYTIELFEAE